jgi:predicted dehydrogenase
MNLDLSKRRIGRRNFLKAIGGSSALAALGTTAVIRGPKRGRPVRAALIGYGEQGKVLEASIDPNITNLVAICDIRPLNQAETAEDQRIKRYQNWQQLLADEQIEAVLVATPPASHAEIAIGCLDAGKHVFCETAIAIEADDSERMMTAARKNQRLLHIGYQDFYQPLLWAAYRNIVKPGLLGDTYTVEAAWHTATSGRIAVDPGASSFDPHFDPRPWGYASVEQLVNWRLYQRYSNGLMGEWGGALISTINWFLDATPTSVLATGGIYSYQDGRDVADHVYATLVYPNGRTATLSLIQSNGFEGSYVQFMGKRATLIVGQDEALLFAEDADKRTTMTAANINASRAVVDTSASRSEEASDHSTMTQGPGSGKASRLEAFRQEIAAFCGAIRTGAPLRVQPTHARNVLLTCVAVNDAIVRNRFQNPQMLSTSQSTA